MTKEALRVKYKQDRMALTTPQQEKFNDLILIQFQSLGLPFLSNIMSYFPLEQFNEPDTFLITRYLKFQNQQLNVAYPKMLPGYEMEAFIATEDSEFAPAAHQVQELTEGETMPIDHIEMIIVPMLCCDYSGNRVGYGKGYYDRFLAKCNKDTLKIGLSFFDPIDEVPTSYGDMPLDICITPDIAYEF